MKYQEEKDGGHLQIVNDTLEIGLDEVGRGCIFGPVFSAIIVISKKNGRKLIELGLDDSKKLSIKAREILIPDIYSLSEDWGIGQSSAREIDKFGIRYATELSMIRAIEKLRDKPLQLMIDGSLPLRLWNGKQTNIIHGESKYPSIAAASVLAKVKRDELMRRIGESCKVYFLHKNNGYGTKEHFAAIKTFGLNNMHRKTFLRKSNIV